jgi:hypothetical protein
VYNEHAVLKYIPSWNPVRFQKTNSESSDRAVKPA